MSRTSRWSALKTKVSAGSRADADLCGDRKKTQFLHASGRLSAAWSITAIPWFLFTGRLVQGRPLMHRIVTVTGDAVQDPRNFSVCTGTSYRELLEAAGGLTNGAGEDHFRRSR